MSNNTPLQEFCERLKKRLSLFPNDMPPSGRGAYDAYLNCLNHATELLQRERNEIELAYNQGDSDRDNQQDGNGRQFKNCMDYYNNTYQINNN